MLFWISLAWAATPEDLSEAVPEALGQLETCASYGCTPKEAAEAAWVVALNTYLSNGVADGTLAATVRELDPELFASFPDVLQSTATEPAAWTPRPGEHQDAVAQAPEAAPNLEPRVDPPARNRAPMFTVSVLSEDGYPIPTAVVRFVDEQDNHRVNTETGRWVGSVRYFSNGAVAYFDKDDTIEVEAFAPGYGYSRTAVTLQKKRNNKLVLTLHPHDLVVPPDAPKFATDAKTACHKWIEASRRYSLDPSDEHGSRVRSAQKRTSRFARDWLDSGGGEEALHLCLMTADIAYCE